MPILAGLGGVCLVFAVTAADAAPKFGEDTLRLRAGGFLSDFDTEIGLQGPQGGDASVDLEDGLGLDANYDAFRGDLVWRFAPNHRLLIGYYDFSRTANGSAQGEFDFETDDGRLITIAGGAAVETNFDWTLLPVRYAYSFVKSDQVEVAASIGAHWFDLELGLAADASIVTNGGPAALGFTRVSEAVSGPLPVFGLHADYSLTSNWVLGGSVEYFTLDYDEYSGELIDLRAQAEYWFTDYVGLGLGYTWYNIDLGIDLGRGYSFSADYTYQGPEAFLTVRF
jgi:hypothetical protein